MAIKSFLKAAQEIQENQRKQSQKKRESGDDDESGWLTSYADLMTLLCGFFIMLFSMATLQPDKIEKVKEDVSEHFQGEYEAPHQELATFVTKILEDAGIKENVNVTINPAGVSVAFESLVFFDSLSAYLRAPGRDVLSSLIDGIQKKKIGEKGFNIVVEGHTDSRPILSGQYPSNWELSAARASRVARLFIARGFEPTQVIPIGYGDTHPKEPNRMPSGEWDHSALQKNRRVVVKIMQSAKDPILGNAPKTEPVQAKAEIQANSVPANSAP